MQSTSNLSKQDLLILALKATTSKELYILCKTMKKLRKLNQISKQVAIKKTFKETIYKSFQTECTRKMHLMTH